MTSYWQLEILHVVYVDSSKHLFLCIYLSGQKKAPASEENWKPLTDSGCCWEDSV